MNDKKNILSSNKMTYRDSVTRFPIPFFIYLAHLGPLFIHMLKYFRKGLKFRGDICVCKNRECHLQRRIKLGGTIDTAESCSALPLTPPSLTQDSWIKTCVCVEVLLKMFLGVRAVFCHDLWQISKGQSYKKVLRGTKQIRF